MVATLEWQLKLNMRLIPAGSFVTLVSKKTLDNVVSVELKEERTGEVALFLVHSNINVGGKDYLLLEVVPANQTSSAALDVSEPISLTVVRLFERTKVCAMDADRFSSLKNAFLMSLESGERSTVQELNKVI